MVEATHVAVPLEAMHRWMTLRGLKPNTVSTYGRIARRFLSQQQGSLNEVGHGAVEQFLLDMVHLGRSPRTRNVSLAAIRCLLRAAVGRDPAAEIPVAKMTRRVPEILSGSEVLLLLQPTKSPKYRAIFMLAYGAGLRVSEITSLHTTDIDSRRMPGGKTEPRRQGPASMWPTSSVGKSKGPGRAWP